MGSKGARRGFTLIELLVVIAIIAILAAIVYPVFKSVQQKARKSACSHNLQQIGIALRIYASDHGERYTLFRDSDDYSITHRLTHSVSGDWGRWGVPRPRQGTAGDNLFFRALAPLVGSQTTDTSKPLELTEIWQCPEDHSEMPPGVTDEAALSDEEWQDLVDSGRKWMAGCSYIFNRSLSGQRENCTTNYKSRPLSVGGKSYFSWPNGPAGTGIMADADAFHVRDRRAHGGYVRANVGNNKEDPEYLAKAPKPGRVFLFCDGHAKFVQIHDNEWPDSEDHANSKDGKNDDTYIWWKPAEDKRVYIWPTSDDWPYAYDKDITVP